MRENTDQKNSEYATLHAMLQQDIIQFSLKIPSVPYCKKKKKKRKSFFCPKVEAHKYLIVMINTFIL